MLLKETWRACRRLLKGKDKGDSGQAMKIIIQRCKDAQVAVNQKVVGKIGTGLMLLVGIGQGDTAVPMPFIWRTKQRDYVYLRILKAK